MNVRKNKMPWQEAITVATLLFFISSGYAEKRGYILTGPGTLTGGSEAVFHLNLFNVKAPGALNITLSKNDNTTFAQFLEEIPNTDTKTLKLQIPKTSDYYYNIKLHVEGKFETADGYAFSGREDLHYRKEISKAIFIQTDKPLYKPTQMVRIRILPLSTKLKPLTGNTGNNSVWIEDPLGSRMAQWNDISFAKGMAQLEMQLSDEPVQGKWKIVFNFLGSNEFKWFSVEEYVLPKFEVIIKPPSFVLSSAEIIPYSICAKYTHGKPVEGKVNITASYEKYAWSSEKVPTLVKTDTINGCYNYDLNVSLLNADEVPNNYFSYRPIQLIASVIEKGTDVNQTSSSKITTHSIPFTLETSYQGNYLKTGLPFYGKINVKNPDGTPSSGKMIRICSAVTWEKTIHRWLAKRQITTCKNYLSNDKGLVEFTVPPQNKFAISVQITAKALNTTDNELNNKLSVPETSTTLQPWYSPSRSFIQIQPIKEELECDKEHNFKLLYTAQEGLNTKMFYQIMSRGQIVRNGTETLSFDGSQVKPADTDDTYIEGESKWETPSDDIISKEENNETNIKGELPLLGQKILPILINSDMSPKARLLVFYVREDGETVSDSEDIPIQKCLHHKVSMKFNKERVQPGTKASLKITATPLSTCGIGVVDKSVELLRSGNKLNKEMVFNYLNSQDFGSFYSGKSYCPDAKDKSVGGSIQREWYTSQYKDSITAFHDGGYFVLSDLTIATRPCTKSSYGYFGGVPYAMPGSGMGGHAGPYALRRTLSRPRPPPPPSPMKPRTENSRIGVSADAFVSKVSGEMAVNSAVEVRTYFPETWLWEMTDIGESGELDMKKEIPHTITEWNGNTVCVSPETGLGISDDAKIIAFQAFFISYTLPYSIVRGEKLPLLVTVFNYLEDCLPIELSLEVNEKFNLLNQTSTEKVCVCGGKSVTIRFLVEPKIIGRMNFTVSGHSVKDENLCKNSIVADVQARDAATHELLVEAEGFPVEKSYSVFFCPQDYANGLFSAEHDLLLPDNVVEGSERAFLSVTGDLMGPAIEGVDGLVRMPSGCGEQNLALLVPNIYVLDYLQATGKMTPESKKKGIDNMNKGYQRQQRYRHQDGSFSAFGKRDKEGSIWLTAFAVKTFSQAKRYITIDTENLKQSAEYIISKQKANGCFPRVGKVFNSGMQGGTATKRNASDATLTAYIAIALLESNLANVSVVEKAFNCFETVKNPTPYSLALFAYATSLAANPKGTDYLKALSQFANLKGGQTYWENSTDTISQSSDVETASYVVLALVTQGDKDSLANATSIIKWIAKMQNPYGGFVSTQDTVVALQALSAFSMAISKDPVELVIAAYADSWNESFTLNEDNKLVVQKSRIPRVPTGVDIEAKGTGCALATASMRYNVKELPTEKHFELFVTANNSDSDDCKTITVNICTRYLPEGEVSNMALTEVKLLSGYVADKDSLMQLSNDAKTQLKKYDADDNKVSLYFDQLDNTMKCFSFRQRENVEIVDLQPSTVHVYDYYSVERTESKAYNIDPCVKRV